MPLPITDDHRALGEVARNQVAERVLGLPRDPLLSR